jgi:16S rRNA (guanine527-N7)-methyltransferase
LTEGSLHDALVSSQRLGMLGDRPVAEVIDHAQAFVGALVGVAGLVVDLGSGGGVPGLVIAMARPDLELLLVDRRAARTDHLARLVRRLGLDGRVAVRCVDAMVVRLDSPADAVVARGFGAPALLARAAVRILAPDGILVVSEPPAVRRDRWIDAVDLERVAWPDARVAVLHHVPRGT